MWWTEAAEVARLLPAVWRSRWAGAPPYKLLLAVTERCNQRCGHCEIWRRAPQPELSPDEIRRALESLPSLRWLDITGGEPTTYPQLDELTRALVRAGEGLVFAHFVTNGGLPERAERFARGLSRLPRARLVVSVSIDGDAALHDQMRGREGAFSRAVETVQRLDRLPGVAVYVGTTLTPENQPHLARVEAALTEALPAAVPARWHVNVMTRSAHFFGNDGQVGLDDDATQEALRFVEARRGVPRDAFALVEKLFARGHRWWRATGRAPAPCQALRASAYVSARGEVFGCHVLPHRVGDLREAGYDLSAILAGPAAEAERRRIAARGCASCWTPCEAYHAIAASPATLLLRTLDPRSQ
jgi:MoaA/NifB/PqqE/SkfB family radical SAM enzyme